MVKRSIYADMTAEEILDFQPKSVSKQKVVDNLLSVDSILKSSNPVDNELLLCKINVSELLAEKEKMQEMINNSKRLCEQECNEYVEKMKKNDDETITKLTDKISKLSVEKVDDEETITILTDQISKNSKENKRLKQQNLELSEFRQEKERREEEERLRLEEEERLRRRREEEERLRREEEERLRRQEKTRREEEERLRRQNPAHEKVFKCARGLHSQFQGDIKGQSKYSCHPINVPVKYINGVKQKIPDGHYSHIQHCKNNCVDNSENASIRKAIQIDNQLSKHETYLEKKEEEDIAHKKRLEKARKEGKDLSKVAPPSRVRYGEKPSVSDMKWLQNFIDEREKEEKRKFDDAKNKQEKELEYLLSRR